MFIVQLERRSAAWQARPFESEDNEHDCDPEDQICLLSSLCLRLQRSGALRFVLAGFGKDDWQMDVGADLCTLLEGLPEVLEYIANPTSESPIVELYEQGTEMCLRFRSEGSNMIIECETAAKPQRNPNFEIIAVCELERDLRRLVSDFIGAVRDFAPETFAATWFQDWSNAKPLYDACRQIPIS